MTPEDADTERRKAVLGEASEILAPLKEHGWEIRTSCAKADPFEVDITVQHPLSSSITFVHVLGSKQVTERLRALVASHEVARVSRAPEIMRHAQLIGALRNTASAERWPDGCFRVSRPRFGAPA